MKAEQVRAANDDFDGIPLEGYVPPSGPPGPMVLCWSCQNSKPLNRTVSLSDECILPCCMTCWEKMPVADRLKVAGELATYTARNEANEALRDLSRLILKKIQEAEGGSGDDYSWLTGRRN